MPSNQSILITGASGLLGRSVHRQLARHANFRTCGTAFRRAADGLLEMNLLDPTSVRRVMSEAQPALIIHCAAERRPDVSEENRGATLALNVDATAALARETQRHHCRLIYISTDYVFDGTTPPYAPHATPHPLNFYGKSKLLGEQTVAEILPRQHYILRLPILYGPVTRLDECPATALAQHLLKQEPITLDNWAIRFPTFTGDVAHVLQQMAEKIFTQQLQSGIYHWQADEPFTKYEMARVMGNVMGISTAHLSPEDHPISSAPRPKNCRLDCSALEQQSVGRRSSFYGVIKELLKPFF